MVMMGLSPYGDTNAFAFPCFARLMISKNWE